MLHEIAFDDQGSITLAEFLRLAGLYAVDAADGTDLAVEFADHEMTLTLSPEEMADTTAYDWYRESFRAYEFGNQAWEWSLRDDENGHAGELVRRYLALLDSAAEYLMELAGRADAPVTEIAPVLPLRPRS